MNEVCISWCKSLILLKHFVVLVVVLYFSFSFELSCLDKNSIVCKIETMGKIINLYQQ